MPPEDRLGPIVEFIERKTLKNVCSIGSKFPFLSAGGAYQASSPSAWTAGFWPGLLWLIHQQTGDPLCRETAEACELQQDEVLQQFVELDHDMGFIWTLTSLASYKLTGNSESRRRALAAASHLAGRFNLKAGIIRAQNDRTDIPGGNIGITIMDCLMNLPLLYWASAATDDPRFRHIAEAHTDSALERLVRPDGSTAHVARFDPWSGQFLEVRGGQGYGADSAWSRGAAWAIYGLALGYSYTGRPDYLEGARRVADFFLAQLPASRIPGWDFRLPDPAGQPWDSSAAAIAAGGLIELAVHVPGAEGLAYQQAAADILQALYEICGTQRDDGEQGLLLHATGNYPAGKQVDVPLIYGDYFFAEAVLRLAGRPFLRFW
jgi:unsaturated chondroitin disaccharide hydrolase